METQNEKKQGSAPEMGYESVQKVLRQRNAELFIDTLTVNDRQINTYEAFIKVLCDYEKFLDKQ